MISGRGVESMLRRIHGRCGVFGNLESGLPDRHLAQILRAEL
jgi:hypothetical protein